ncbi:hypothetical protein EON65_08095 [archaeon]|nr:MAG: hypothetical protein EON65_08095 [archaeon]
MIYKPVESSEVISRQDAIARIQQRDRGNKKGRMKRSADVASLDKGRSGEQSIQQSIISNKRVKTACTPQLLLQSPPPSPAPNVQEVQEIADTNVDENPGNGSQGFFGDIVSAMSKRVTTIKEGVSTILSSFSPTRASAVSLPPPPSLPHAPVLALLGDENREGVRIGNLKKLGSKGSEPPSTQQAADSLLALSFGSRHKKGLKSNPPMEEDDLIDSADITSASEEEVRDDVSEFNDDDDYDQIISKPKVQVVDSTSKYVGNKENARRNIFCLGRLQKGQSKKLYKK